MQAWEPASRRTVASEDENGPHELSRFLNIPPFLPHSFCWEPWFSIENRGPFMTTPRGRVTVRGTIAQVGRMGSTGFAGEVPSPSRAGVGSNGKRLTIKDPQAAVAIVSVD